jgi:hypothetical protein
LEFFDLNLEFGGFGGFYGNNHDLALVPEQTRRFLGHDLPNRAM